MVATIREAVGLVQTVCRRPANKHYLDRTAQDVDESLGRAVESHDTARIYDWLVSGYSYQGISDRIAAEYIHRHGNASWPLLESVLRYHHCRCPKLGGFEAYSGCGYRKAANTCSNPSALPACPVAHLPLRKGDLNQLSFSLYFFLRDHCHGDLVGFIDELFATIDRLGLTDPVAAKRDQLMDEFARVFAASTKLNAMMLSGLLLAGGRSRPDWIKVGQSLVVIDSLVHNFFHRTGILTAFDLPHQYGPRCFGHRGCAGIIRQLADRIDARQVNRAFPKNFPRFVEHAIWAFCAETEADICNGRQIDDRSPCKRIDCPVGGICARNQLRRSPKKRD
jgi:hypothetical protein